MPSTPLLEHYRRLLSLPWGGRDSAGSVGTCGQSGTSSCRVPAAQQERGRLGGLRRAPLDGMASSSNAFVHCHVVFSDGNASGKKTTIRPKARIDFSLRVLNMLWWALDVNHRPT